MAYNAVVAKIKTAPHPNADRLQLGYVCGARVIVGLDTHDDELGVYFPPDGQLSKEFAEANDLVVRKDENGNKVGGGYFDDKRRVRAQAFRSVKSEGFWVPLSYFSFTGYDISKLEPGAEFDTLNKVPICNKYYTKATLAAMQGQGKKKMVMVDMPEHYETTQFRFVDIPDGAHVIITEKEHGTSVRYGNVITRRQPRTLVEKLKVFFSKKKVIEEYAYALGTRRAILPKVSELEYGGGFYGNGDPYTIAPAKLNGKLKEGEVVYGEVVGYLKTGAALFSQGTEKLPEIKKQYGAVMNFSYGCLPEESRLKVYRITQNGRDLSHFELVRRCDELGVETVRYMDSLVFDGDRDGVNALVESYLEGPSLADPTHIREGVCLRIESEHGIRIVKAKSWSFGVLEGYIKDNDNYVDMEEIA